jgi:hypothetical protein
MFDVTTRDSFRRRNKETAVRRSRRAIPTQPTQAPAAQVNPCN